MAGHEAAEEARLKPKPHIIKEYFDNYLLQMSDITFDMVNDRMDVHHRKAEPRRITLVDTGEQMLTGGRLKRVSPYVKDEPFFFA